MYIGLGIVNYIDYFTIDYCRNSITVCELINLDSSPFSTTEHPQIKIGDKSDDFSLYLTDTQTLGFQIQIRMRCAHSLTH